MAHSRPAPRCRRSVSGVSNRLSTFFPPIANRRLYGAPSTVSPLLYNWDEATGSQAPNRPVSKYAGLVAGSIGRVLVYRFFHDTIPPGTNAFGQTPVWGFRAAGNARALD